MKIILPRAAARDTFTDCCYEERTVRSNNINSFNVFNKDKK